jgi:hypothetical protein
VKKFEYEIMKGIPKLVKAVRSELYESLLIKSRGWGFFNTTEDSEHYYSASMTTNELIIFKKIAKEYNDKVEYDEQYRNKFKKLLDE